MPQVQLIGNGTVYDHEGIPEAILNHSSHRAFHKTCVTLESEAAGTTRFCRWHMDAALYALAPSRVTTLHALRVPRGPPQTCLYDDGSGDALSVSLAATAFISGHTMFDILPQHLRSLAVRARARYAPHPFVWMSGARAKSTGLGLESEGRERPLDQLPPWDEAHIKVYPLVW